MDGLWFLIAAVAVCLVVFWAVRNDRVGLTGETTGLFRMRRAQAAGEEPDGTRPPGRGWDQRAPEAHGRD